MKTSCQPFDVKDSLLALQNETKKRAGDDCQRIFSNLFSKSHSLDSYDQLAMLLVLTSTHIVHQFYSY